MTKEHLDKMERCADMLPEPGGEVVRSLLTRIRERDDHIFRLESAHAMGTNARIAELEQVLEAVRSQMCHYADRDELAMGFYDLMTDVSKVLEKKGTP